MKSTVFFNQVASNYAPVFTHSLLKFIVMLGRIGCLLTIIPIEAVSAVQLKVAVAFIKQFYLMENLLAHTD